MKKGAFKMKIDIRTEDCLYIEINNNIFYIDDSTGEAIISSWKKSEHKIVTGEGRI